MSKKNKKQVTIESLEQKLELAKLGLNNPKITTHAGRNGALKKRIKDIEAEISAFSSKPTTGAGAKTKSTKADKPTKVEKVKKPKVDRVATGKRAPAITSANGFKVTETVKFHNKKLDKKETGEIVRIEKQSGYPGKFVMIIQNKAGDRHLRTPGKIEKV